MVDTFGKPNASNFEQWFTAANFLGYGNNLKVVRPVTGMVNAGVSGTPILIKNTTDYVDNYGHAASFAAAVGPWAAREPGTLGNNLQVSVCSNSTAFGPHGMSGNLVDDASAAIGDTTVTVDDGTLCQAGDILEFGDASACPSTSGAPSGHYYKYFNC